jgi:UDP-galactopyranose mutase
MGFAVGQLGEQFSVYHIVDEYQGYTGVTSDDRDRLATHEADVLDRVDLAVVASPELANAKGGPGRDIVVLENGVNPEEYSAARRNPDYPADIGQVPSPRIGYSGLIGKRLNFKLITALAEQRKDYSIVLVGRVDTRECSEEIAHLKSLPNVYFLGEKNANDVAAYINCLDVGLLPYAVNLETENISPIKMYEYWAAGKPVVGTSIPATRRNSAAVAIANSTQEFIAEVEKAVGARDKSAQKLLIRLASKNSWQSRVDSISAEIQARLQSTAGRARAG